MSLPVFSSRVQDLQASPIREILAVVARPGMISFAGGLPAPETFPEFSGSMPAAQYQYGASEGDSELRACVAEDLRRLGFDCAINQILILSGSQQGIDLAAKLFIDPGTAVAVESPTYLAALQVFRFFGARLMPFSPEDSDQRQFTRDAPAPAFVYAIPTFQNPTGHCYTAAQRAALASRCDAAQTVLFEDDPYRDLFYEPCDRRPIASLLRRASWIYQGSFSKSLAPGLRLGFLAASPDLIPYLTRLKQAADLHSSRLGQWLVLQQLRDPGRADRLANLAATYRAKRDVFAALLERHLGGLATWRTPAGGLFFWLRLRAQLDTRALLAPAIARGIAFMPGEPFYPHEPGASGALRLNFSLASESQADAGLSILAELLDNA